MGGDKFDDDDPKYKMELKQLIKTKNKCNLKRGIVSQFRRKSNGQRLSLDESQIV